LYLKSFVNTIERSKTVGILEDSCSLSYDGEVEANKSLIKRSRELLSDTCVEETMAGNLRIHILRTDASVDATRPSHYSNELIWFKL
jgi:hypothetical protein